MDKFEIHDFIEYIKTTADYVDIAYCEAILDLHGDVYLVTTSHIGEILCIVGVKFNINMNQLRIECFGSGNPLHYLINKFGYCAICTKRIVIPDNGLTPLQFKSLRLLVKNNIITENFTVINKNNMHITSSSYCRLTETDRKLLQQLIHIILFKKNLFVGESHLIAIVGVMSSTQLISYCQEIDEFNPIYTTVTEELVNKTHDIIIEVIGFNQFDDLIKELIINMDIFLGVNILNNHDICVVNRYIPKHTAHINNSTNETTIHCKTVGVKYTSIELY